MSKKLKVYTDLSLLHIGEPVQMLMPFMPASIVAQETNVIEAGRYDDYLSKGKDLIQLTPIEDCDVCLLPVYYELANNRSEFEKRIAPFLAQVSKHSKKLLIFAGHDVKNVNINIPNTVIFNSAVDKSTKASNHYSWPHFFEDFVQKYNGGQLTVRRKGAKPVVGFCGYAPPLNIGFGREKIISTLKLGLNYMGLIQLLSQKVSHSYRARAIIGLQKSHSITTNFRLKSTFAFGPSGLNTGNTAESNVAFRRSFVDNIMESDYTLCVRGIGNNSIRFFETICCGRIPVFVNTDSVLPFDHLIDWKKLCVWVEEKDIDRIGDFVADFHQRISEEEFMARQQQMRAIWEEYFSPTGFFKNTGSFIGA